MPITPKQIIAAVAALVLVILALGTFFTVAAYERAIVTRFGRIIATEGEGLHFKAPWDSIHKIPTGIKNIMPKNAQNTYTIDNQEVDIIFNLFYRVPPENVEFVYRNVPDYELRLMELAVDRLKSEMGKVNTSAVAKDRGTLRDKIRAVLKHDAESIGLAVTDFQLTNLEYSKDFRLTVEKAAIAKAVIETREHELEQEKKVADSAKVRAEGIANAARAAADGQAYSQLALAKSQADATRLQGDAEASRIEAHGKANAVSIEARGRAEAVGIDLAAKALAQNSQLVELEKAKRWTGTFPQTMLSSVMPFMNVDQAAAARQAQR